MIDTVVKVGGSLESTGHLPALVTALERLVGTGHCLLVVPGGGRFADQVRQAGRKNDDEAHWAAIGAMDTMADELLRLSIGGLRVTDVGGALAALARRRLPILAPADWLRVADPLPHSWDVTSDSIAAWFAAQVFARQLVLLKSVDLALQGADRSAPGFRAGRDEMAALARKGIVDNYLQRVLEPGLPCWLINGAQPERVVELFEKAAAPAGMSV